jgi:hypothetical protein
MWLSHQQPLLLSGCPGTWPQWTPRFCLHGADCMWQDSMQKAAVATRTCATRQLLDCRQAACCTTQAGSLMALLLSKLQQDAMQSVILRCWHYMNSQQHASHCSKLKPVHLSTTISMFQCALTRLCLCLRWVCRLQQHTARCMRHRPLRHLSHHRGCPLFGIHMQPAVGGICKHL